MSAPWVTYEVREHSEDTNWQTGELVDVLYRCEDGIAVEELGRDGGEPEDNSFHRDWSWVPGALQAAYELGRSHAMNTVWLVHETRDYSADTVYVFDSKEKAAVFYMEKGMYEVDKPYEAVVE